MLRRAALIFSLSVAPWIIATGQSAPIVVNPTNVPDIAGTKPPEAAPLPAGTKILKPSELEGRQKLNDVTRMQLIRVMDAEFVHVRKFLPAGEKNLVIGPDGTIKPGDSELYRKAQTFGATAKIGDRVQITNIVFREKSIYFEINGGPKKKTKWYQRIEISGMGGSTGGNDPKQTQVIGAAVILEFSKHVPEMTGPELKQMLIPVLDFSVKTAAEVFVDTMPPKIKQAVKQHEVLVGMNHDMVVMAKDRPGQKVRDKDDKGKEYEEWIYGTPPQDVVFVRFVGDEVTQVKIAKVGGQMIVKTQKEVDVKDGVPTLAAMKSSDTPQGVSGAPQPDQPKHKPTLKRPDEQPDPAVQGQTVGAGQTTPADQHEEEPQWGNKPADGSGQQPSDGQSKPPQEQPKQPPL